MEIVLLLLCSAKTGTTTDLAKVGGKKPAHCSLINNQAAVWTSIRNEALCNNFLAERGFCHGLDLCINKDAGTPSVSPKMMATAVEAILGAVHLDGGDDALRRVLTRLRIVNPYELPVTFSLLISSRNLIQIRYDLFILTFIGLIREGLKVALLRGSQAP